MAARTRRPAARTGARRSSVPVREHAVLPVRESHGRQTPAAIVAYLRSLKAVAHEVKANAGTFATQPTAPQWTPADPTKLPAPSADASADATNGKYLATLLCVTCHTVNTSATSPLHIDEAKAFQGGKTSTIAVDGGSMMFQAANLTPDATGIKTWSTGDIITAIISLPRTSSSTLSARPCAPTR